MASAFQQLRAERDQAQATLLQAVAGAKADMARLSDGEGSGQGGGGAGGEGAAATRVLLEEKEAEIRRLEKCLDDLAGRFEELAARLGQEDEEESVAVPRKCR